VGTFVTTLCCHKNNPRPSICVETIIRSFRVYVPATQRNNTTSMVELAVIVCPEETHKEYYNELGN
jgi:hypothetical protein